MRPASPAAVFLLATLVLVWSRPANGSPIAFDHAGDPEYDAGWQNGTNGGYGFELWVLRGGSFEISSSTQNNPSPRPPSGGDIDSPGGRSWRLDVFAPGNAVATRRLNVPLAVGQAVTVGFDSVMAPNAESGISLFGRSGGSRLRVFDLGAAYALTDAGGYRAFAPGGTAKYGVHLTITLTGPDSYQLEFATPGEPATVRSGVLGGMPGSSIDAIVFDRSGFSGSFGYFNNLSIIPEPAGCGLLASFAILLVHRRRIAPGTSSDRSFSGEFPAPA